MLRVWHSSQKQGQQTLEEGVDSEEPRLTITFLGPLKDRQMLLGGQDSVGSLEFIQMLALRRDCK